MQILILELLTYINIPGHFYFQVIQAKFFSTGQLLFCSLGDFKKQGTGVLTVTTSTTTYLQNKYKAKESHAPFCVFGLSRQRKFLFYEL